MVAGEDVEVCRSTHVYVLPPSGRSTTEGGDFREPERVLVWLDKERRKGRRAVERKTGVKPVEALLGNPRVGCEATHFRVGTGLLSVGWSPRHAYG